MSNSNAAGRQEGPLNPQALSLADAARILSASGVSPVTVEMLQGDIAGGAPKDARHDARQKQYDADLKASEDSVKQARKDWQAALDEAAKKRAALSEETGPGGTKRPGMPELPEIEGIGRRAASVQGTFNAMAVRGLESSGPAERTARGVAKNTKELVKEAKLGGLVFS